MPLPEEFFSQLGVAWAAVANTWWLWVPPLLFYAGFGLYKVYLRVRYSANLTWVLLEVKIPRDIAKTPEAMEQIFAGLQTMYWGFDPIETYWEGLQHDYVVFELASVGGATHFYIRTPIYFRNMIEAQVYAQYPEAELAEVEDYMQRLPVDVPSEEWDIFGIEFNLERPDAYPIKTYRDYQSLTPGEKEFAKVDPFSSMVECFGKCTGSGAHMGLHLMLRPVQTPSTDHWKKEGEKLVAKLIGQELPQEKGLIAKALEPFEPVTRGWGEPLRPLFGIEPGGAAVPAERPKRSEASLMQHLSPGTKDIVAAIERNILKPGFEVIVRLCVIGPRQDFATNMMQHVSSFIGALKTYNTQTMNAFKLNSGAMATLTTWWWLPYFKRRLKGHKKRLFYQYYRIRKPFIDTWSLRSTRIVLNTEELATIFHFPTMTSKAPMMPRIEAKRSEPPATLPVG